MNEKYYKLLYYGVAGLLVVALGAGIWILYLGGFLPVKPRQTGEAPADVPVVAQAPGAEDAGYLKLVNEFYPLPDDYEADGLVNLADVRPPNTIGLKSKEMLGNETAFAALCAMAEEMKVAGYEGLVVIAAHRTMEYQQTLFQEEGEGKSRWGKPLVQPPAATEHRTGLAFDLSVMDGDGNTLVFADTPHYPWVLKNMHRYGFILRYPEDKQDITGIGYEPWHVRYVGIEHAKQIKEQGLCLEEYLGKYRP